MRTDLGTKLRNDIKNWIRKQVKHGQDAAVVSTNDLH